MVESVDDIHGPATPCYDNCSANLVTEHARIGVAYHTGTFNDSF